MQLIEESSPQKTKSNSYIYTYGYSKHEQDLALIEITSLFNTETDKKYIISEKCIDPSISPFLKKRLHILIEAQTKKELYYELEKSSLKLNNFKIEYIKVSDNYHDFQERLALCRELGLRIQGNSSYQNPETRMGIIYTDNKYYFGYLLSNNLTWKNHISKPHSYSNSLSINIAKALVNIAGNGDFTKTIVDPCCGVGTVLLEGLFAGYNISGWEINKKIAHNARANLIHYNYQARVTHGDIISIKDFFDSSIVDLPYGIYSETTIKDQVNIISNAKRISNKVIIVSASDISNLLKKIDLSITHSCIVTKAGKGNFTRFIWVCQ